LLLWIVRIGLSHLRYPVLLHLLQRSARRLRTSSKAPKFAEDRVVSAVRHARRFGTGKISCLEEALSIQWMLRRRNIEAQLQIGVKRTDNDQLVGHAWVESVGKIISIDLDSPSSYTVLTSSTNELPNESYRRHSTL
jgi:hypothetical protein